MQERAICFKCDNVIEHSPVYEAPCGHPEHSSAVFHGLCLMEFREWREEAMRKAREEFRRAHPSATERPEEN